MLKRIIKDSLTNNENMKIYYCRNLDWDMYHPKQITQATINTILDEIQYFIKNHNVYFIKLVVNSMQKDEKSFILNTPWYGQTPVF